MVCALVAYSLRRYRLMVCSQRWQPAACHVLVLESGTLESRGILCVHLTCPGMTMISGS